MEHSASLLPGHNTRLAPALERHELEEPARVIPLPPLVVDLDEALLETSLVLESLFNLLRQAPLCLFALPFWLLRGRARFKRELARRVRLDVHLLPYRTSVVERLRAEHDRGRSIVLGTDSDERLAQQVADHLKLFDSILASDGRTNFSGKHKRERLSREFGERGFDYLGGRRSNGDVWRAARTTSVVNANRGLLRTIAKVTAIQDIFEDDRPALGEYVNVLRPQHWLKNLLVFVPLLAAHHFDDAAQLRGTLLAFVAFCCVASSGYLFNDLFDLSADRHHPTKRYRSFVSGRLPLSYALAAIPALIVVGYALVTLVSQLLVGIFLLYLALTVAYSLFFKTVVVLDVVALAGLYTLRIMTGAAVIRIWPSEWLVVFSIFLFLSLALVKRYSELVVMRSIEGDHAKARSYELSDAELLASTGIASGYIAILVLALYITSGEVKAHCQRPAMLWFVCPLLLYWVGYVWLMAHRGRVHDDPIAFALRNSTSRILIVLMVAAALLAI